MKYTISQVTYHNDNGMAEVFVYINGLREPLIFFDEDDNDQTIHIYEYWMQMYESGEQYLEMHG